MDYKQLLEQLKTYVINYYQTHENRKLIYHNLEHIEQVALAAINIANHYQLNDHDFFIVMAAVWFHDTGNLTTAEGHEEESAKLAEDFLFSRVCPRQTLF